MAEIIHRCRVCNRPLTSEKSIKRGMGPVCARKRKRMDEYWEKVNKEEAEGWIKCPNCDDGVSQLELDENRGVCGLCAEFFVSKGRGMDPEEVGEL